VWSTLLAVLLLACGRVGVRLYPADAGRLPAPDAGQPAAGDAGDQPAADGSVGADASAACASSCANEHGSAECGSGQCVLTCSIGYLDCDADPSNGCEADTAASSGSCGGCNTICSNEHGSTSCASGLCQPTCSPGFADCDAVARNGCETALSAREHCGACGTVCNNAHGSTVCVAGACVPTCSSGYADCDGRTDNGCETQTDSDPLHCGSCQTTCNTEVQVCSAGSCQISMCSPGRGECDGDVAEACETDLMSSAESCGFCGNTCALPNAVPACVASSCSVSGCDSGYADCDGQAATGCEVTLASDPAHCGGCGVGCSNANGTTSCAAGNCSPVCGSGWGDCDGDPNDGCETALTSVTNCGMCGRSCPANGGTPTCNAGVCGTRCDLNGLFALKLIAPATWPGTSVLAAGSGTFTFWAKLQVSQNNLALNTTVTPCGELVPDFAAAAFINETYGITYPNSTFDNNTLASVSSTGSLGGTAPGSSFALARNAWMMGVSLSDPINAAWPSRTSLTSVDGDADTKIGVTGSYKSGSGYSNPPVNSVGSVRANRAYIGTRTVFTLSGTLNSCSASSGSATVQDVDYHTIGCRLASGSDCSNNDTNYLDTNGPNYQTGSASYTLTRVDANASCAQVRAALP